MMKLTTLANGLKIATRTMPGAETAAVSLHAEIGSRHEPARINGIAHLFEHMVFKGAGGRNAREISEAIEDVGGELNAATDRDSTVFTASILPEHMALGLELIADMIQRPHFAAADLEREKDVVLQELGEARDTPNDIIFDDLHMAAFADQALGRSVLGDEASIESILGADLQQWRDRYRTGSLCLVAAGKVDHDRVVELAEHLFDSLLPGDIEEPDSAIFTGGNRVGRGNGDQAHLALGFTGPGLFHADSYATRLFADIAGGGASSRLFQQLREERGMAYSVWASFQPWRDCGLVSVYAATARTQSAPAAQLVEQVLAETAESATDRELARVKTQAKAALLMWLESPWGQANYLARQVATYGRLVEPSEIVAKIDAISLERVRSAGKAMLAGPRARATIGFAAVRAA
ncbi:MAG: M16 family metallopeptidase [Allosphingosinicella sp.]